uniref:ATP synthase F0 subunit 6 n=1 Tax=Goniurosaurus bawanglingensis TaxID=2234022 RepID=UPI002A80D8FB|nr:ATP synthase F0 subunit 6 [Goniurosaurus bawanglingensis]WOA02152.1 ATP synthase F0 subunit 6 [Goniurosaurus bawanglingensis]
MISNLFDQFLTPTLFGVPLMLLALLMPNMLLTKQNEIMTNRLSTIQSWVMKIYIKQLMSPINPNAHKWTSTLLALMTFLIMLNLLGLLPYTFTPTTQLAMNMALAIPFWFMTIFSGIRHQPTNTIGHLLPMGTPSVLVPPLIIIETISLFIRPLALGIRLTANLTAGHLLMQLISSATMALYFITPSFALLAFIMLTLLTLLEMAVAMIQAYVFVLLITLYLQENT